MSDLPQSFRFSDTGYGGSSSASPTNATVPSINIGGSPASPASPVNELLGRSLDIKKQLSQSFHGHSAAVSGGVSKPKSRRNSAYHIKAEDADSGENGHDNDNEDKEEQGIERKRRDNINEKIQELLTLIPAEYFQESKDVPVGAPNATQSGQTIPPHSSQSQAQNQYDELAMAKSTGTRDGKPNKGQILTQAVEYIQYLQNLIDENNRREVELFLKMKTLEKSPDPNAEVNVPIAVEATSAEKALGEIGVGPESEQYFRSVLIESSGAFKVDS